MMEPIGYAVRYALSHHLGGWAPCEGLPRCKHCRDAERLRVKCREARQGTETAAQSVSDMAAVG